MRLLPRLEQVSVVRVPVLVGRIVLVNRHAPNCTFLAPQHYKLSPAPPHTATRLPAHPPSHNRVEHVRSSRCFQSSELMNVSSSVLNSEKMLREATRIIFRFARLSATVRRRGSSRNPHEASR